MKVKKLEEIAEVLKDWLVSIYLYQKGDQKIPVFIVKEVNFVFLDSLRSLFAREQFIMLTEDDIREWNDVFCLKLLHIKNHSEIFYGTDILSQISFDIGDLKSSLELEIRNKRIQLREEYLSQTKGRHFMQYLLPWMQILWEWLLSLKTPKIKLPADTKELLSLFDIAWSCNSQIFYYLIEGTLEEKSIPSFIHDTDEYLSDLCRRVN